MAALYNLTEGSQAVSGKLFGTLTEAHFKYAPCRDAYRRIRSIGRSTGSLPGFDDICHDTTIPEENRLILSEYEGKLITSKEKLDSLIHRLDEYRVARGINDMIEEANDQLSSESCDPFELQQRINDTMSMLRVNSDMERQLRHIGTGNNSVSLVKKILNKEKPECIPTGFMAFDERNGGLFPGSLVLIAGTTGGGKSVLALNLLHNMSVHGDTVLVSLEMTEEETMCRHLSRMSGIELTKIIKKKLTDSERLKIQRSYVKYMKHLQEGGTKYSLFSPEEDMTMEDILFFLRPYGYKVIVIDYMSLLKGVDGDDSWQQLSKAARVAKIYAKNTGSVVVILGQLSEEGLVRYSRAMAEHCVTGDTLINTSTGLVRIDSLYPNASIMSTKLLKGIKVKSENGYVEASHIHYNGVRKVYNLRLSNGMSIKGTSRHKFRVLSPDGTVSWVELGRLLVGNYVAIDYAPSIFNRKVQSIRVVSPDIHFNNRGSLNKEIQIDEPFAYLLGCLSSDGYLGKHGVQFIASDIAIFNKYSKCWGECFGKGTYNTWRGKTPKGVKIWRHYSTLREINRFLISIIGMTGKAQGKFFPDILLQAPKNVMCSYLAGLFDGDSAAYPKSLILGSVSIEQLHRVQIVLSALGIRSRITKTRLEIVGEHATRFSDMVGLTKDKTIQLETNTSNDYLPQLIKDRMSSLVECKSLRFKSRTVTAYKSLCKILSGVGSSYSYRRGSKPVPNLKYSDLNYIQSSTVGTPFEGLFDSLKDFEYNRFIEIESIEVLGEERVYDLTVPGNHSYVANGIVVHNSNNAFTFVSTDESKAEGIMEIRQTKARNQEMFTFQLGINLATMTVSDLTSYSDPSDDEGDTRQRPKSPKYLKDVGDIEEED